MIRDTAYLVPGAASAAADATVASGADDAGAIRGLLFRIRHEPRWRLDVWKEASRLQELHDPDQDPYPKNGCASTLSVLLKRCGIDVGNEVYALRLVRQLLERGWERVPVGQQRAGDVGTTCGDERQPGIDHVYFVLDVDPLGGMTVVDNQDGLRPHWRPTEAQESFSPTTTFLRAPTASR
ncbi:hypothetical protein [Roseateles sp.]|uniref:hypothetical protein n=1 Tax=Roseateles sp. TaxID=1971397 RepID=UPI0031DAADCF